MWDGHFPNSKSFLNLSLELFDGCHCSRVSGRDFQLSTCSASLLFITGGRGSELLRGAGLWSSAFATPITSVYFDGPDMGMYAERLKRSEGARLFRIRWYGPNRPQGEETVFLELKTHHESWIGDASVKERVAIREEDVARLLDVSDGR